MPVAGLSWGAQTFGSPPSSPLCPHHSPHHQSRPWEGKGWGLRPPEAAQVRGETWVRVAQCTNLSPRSASSPLTAHSSAPLPDHPIGVFLPFVPAPHQASPSPVCGPGSFPHRHPGHFHAQLQLPHFQTPRPAEVTAGTVERAWAQADTAIQWAASRCLVLWTAVREPGAADWPARSWALDAGALVEPAGMLTGSDSAAEKASGFLHSRRHLLTVRTGEGRSRLGAWASQILWMPRAHGVLPIPIAPVLRASHCPPLPPPPARATARSIPSPTPYSPPQLTDHRSPATGHPPSLQPQREAGSRAGPGPRVMKVRRRSYTVQGSTQLGSHWDPWESARLDLSHPQPGGRGELLFWEAAPGGRRPGNSGS